MHALGLQGSRGGVVEDNYIHHCVDGIVFYVYPGADGNNNIVRRNYLSDFNYNTADPNPMGISFGSNSIGALGNTSGNEIHDNIIVGAHRGLYYKWSDHVKIYNNVVVDAVDAFRFAGVDVSATNIELKNNIAYNISRYFIYYIASPDNTYSIQSDNNLFYPMSSTGFYYQNSTGSVIADFDQWKALSAPNCTFDPNTLTKDPLFEDYENRDFHLKNLSPAIDSGVDVWFTSDFEGNPVPQGNGTDIGAFEYQSVTCSIRADLNTDCAVNLLDLQIVTMDFGRTSGYDPRADTVLDGEIDIYDVVYVASRFT